MKENMEDEVSNHVLLPNSDSSSNILDDLLRNAQTCTHTHTCNRDAAHTHTCLHTHTHVIPPEQTPVSKPRRHLGNREAVRRYREKKKAHAVYLEEEVKKLRLMNQVLMGKLQKRAILEAEIAQLRTLLLDLRGKIDIELGDGKECSSSMNKIVERECGNNLGCNLGGSSGCGETRGGIDCEANLKYVTSSAKCLHESLGELVSSSPQELG